MAAQKIEFRLYRLPLRQPLKLARGPVLTHREGVLLRVLSENGQIGFGDAAPLPGWSTESLQDVCHALERGELDAPLPSLQFALDSAVRAWSPYRPKKSLPLSKLLIPGEPWPSPSPRSVKLKLPASLEQSLAFLQKTLPQLGPDSSLRLDANRQFTFDQALRIAEFCEGRPLEFFEEPTHEVEKLGRWPGLTPIPLAVDETLRELGPEHPACEAAQFFVIKPTLTGDWGRCLHLASLGKQAVLSSCFESDIGIRSIGELAACLPQPVAPLGLDTYSWLASRLIAPLPIHENLYAAGEPPPAVIWDELAP